jgi:ABC-type bacteriocin/lantibiotic exporter with double-glycine peptidase domain
MEKTNDFKISLGIYIIIMIILLIIGLILYFKQDDLTWVYIMGGSMLICTGFIIYLYYKNKKNNEIYNNIN